MAVEGIQLEQSFSTSAGTSPFAGLTSAGGDIYYGTTVSAANNGYGGVYRFSSSTGSISLIDSFNSSNGSVPFADLTAAGSGLYFGTTETGGTDDLGAVYAFDSGTGRITLKDSFNGANGAHPYAALTAAGGGLYYGTTQSGGAHDKGGVFAFDSTTGTITLRDSFNGANGSSPLSSLTDGGGGLYYGTAGEGGSQNLGGVFVFDSAAGTISLKASFTGPNGAIPHAALTAAGGTLYYGTTRFGGAHAQGAVFAFNSATETITLKASFTGPNGSAPFAPLTAAGGNLYYGTTRTGGVHGLGTVYEFNSIAGAITLKDSFSGSNGANPLAGLTAGAGGLYYGTTENGGANNLGAVYSFNPVPGPLALMGAGAGLGWSRRLRRRVQASQKNRRS